jgi:hypothetical protein
MVRFAAASVFIDVAVVGFFSESLEASQQIFTGARPFLHARAI